MSEWEEFKLGDLVTHQKGFAFKSADYRLSGHPIVRVSNFTDRSINMVGCSYLNSKNVSQYEAYKLQHRDVVIATVGSWPTNPSSVVDKTISVPINADGSLLNQNAVCLRGNSFLDQIFLFYRLKSQDFQTHLVSSAQGSASQASITLSDIFGFEFLLPPPPEQKAIASILSSLDDKIELNQRMNETLEAMARAIFKDWFVDFGPTRAKQAGRAAYLPEHLWSLFPEAIDLETGLPQGWNIQPISNNCTRVVNGGTPKRNNNEYWDNGDVPWLTSREVRQKIIVETQNFITQKGLLESSAKIIDSGSTVVALYGATAGQVSYLATEVSTNQAICALTPKANYQIYNYLYLSNGTDTLANMARGSAP